MHINELAEVIHDTALAKGWWRDCILNNGEHFDPSRRNVGESFLLMQSEISEAFEEWRAGKNPKEVYFKDGKPEGIPIELADCIIRILDFCEAWGINIAHALHTKIEFNKSRPYLHGGKRA